MKKVDIEVILRITVEMKEDMPVSEFISEMDYEINAPDGALIIDTEIIDYEVK